MRLALSSAQAAEAAGEVPVGAVVVCDGQVVGQGCNAPIALHDPSAHAEMQALRAAAQALGNYRLDDCELYVTLEPCTMCAGAMLHARLKRVIFGAPDPKTGAAGSALNVFAMRQLNHQTQVTGGVLAHECAELLQRFFLRQRTLQQKDRQQAGRALREDALRAPECCFAALPELPAASFYVSNLPSLAGWRLHYLDSGNDASSTTCCLCLHDLQGWSYAWRSTLQSATNQHQRVICPDLIGFGKSDKPKKPAIHTLAWHAQVLVELIEQLNLQQVELQVAASAWALAEQVQALAPQRISHITLGQSDALDADALAAPYPDKGHCAGPMAFASMTIKPTQSSVFSKYP